ncbi:MAG: aspartate aminotransferase family protein [Alphaproteobacteria bacterium]
MSAVMPTYARIDLAFDRGEGAHLFTADGQRYLDFGAGIAVNALGHAHPHLVETLRAQAGKLWHTSNLYRVPGQERLADRLVAASFADRVFFTNSGAEAMECAIKMARKAMNHRGTPERYRVITFDGAFHGRTLATIAAGGQEKHLEGFGPVMDGFDSVPFGDVAAVKAAITDETAAICFEPILGEGGIKALPLETMRALRAVADDHGLLLIVDEVQTGIGRTGKLFAHELAGIEPDIMALAKGLGGGFPIGACLATEAAAAGMVAGSHGSTFGGNPLAMAVGNAVLDIVLEDGFLQSVQETARSLNQKLCRLLDDHPTVFKGLRGEGLMLGLECVAPNSDVAAAAIEEGLLLVGAGENVVRLLPPLTIGAAEIDEAVSALDRAAAKVAATQEMGETK